MKNFRAQLAVKIVNYLSRWLPDDRVAFLVQNRNKHFRWVLWTDYQWHGTGQPLLGFETKLEAYESLIKTFKYCRPEIVEGETPRQYFNRVGIKPYIKKDD